MNGAPRSDTLASSLDGQIEAICIRFEDAWKAGQQPSLEQYLSEVPPPGQATLLNELLKLELHYRRRNGEQPTPDEYLSRFPDDGELLQQVFTYSAAGARATMDTGAATAAPLAPATGQPRYVPLRFHAGGGLGEVHVARDVELGRRVALKRIRDCWAQDAESRRRFLVEAEITSKLEHPGVVPVYGLVQDRDGQPCYAMRFIQGETLQEALRRFHAADHPGRDSGERGLVLRQLLGRFLTVCNTIAYAHSRGVLHRDLKPANVMFGQYGETLVVDWGLAKPFEQGAAAATAGTETLLPVSRSTLPNLAPEETGAAAGAAGTRTGAAIGTPAYMSPEQARGDRARIGPASDIYSLGATLYAVLTGRAPFEGRSKEEVLANAQCGEFPPPASIKRGIPPALNAICLKALALQPVDRYPTALDLAADVERWLSDEPVSAYREPWRERARRWVKWHRTLMTGALAALVVGAVSLGVATALLGRSNATVRGERDRALAARARTREALDAMTSTVTGDALTTQAALSDEQRRFLEGVLGYYEEFAAEPGEDRQGRERLAAAHFRLAVIGYRLGQTERTMEIFRRSAELNEQLAEEYPAVPAYRHDLARSVINLGVLLRDLGQRTGAEAAFRKALVELERLAADHPAGPAYRQDLARGLIRLGNLLHELGRRPEAEAAFRKALAEQERLAADHPVVPAYRLELAASHTNLGVLLRDLGKRPEAEAAYRRAIKQLERLAGEHPSVPEYRVELAASHTHLGILLYDLGKRPEAEAAYRKALAERERLATDHPAVPSYRRDLAASLTNIGNLFAVQGKWPEAEAAYRKVLAVQERLAADHPAVPEFTIGLGGSYCNQGNLLRDRGEPQAALEWYARAVERLQPLVAAEPRLVTARKFLRNCHWGRALTLGMLGRHADTVSDWDRAIELDDGSDRIALRIGRAKCLVHVGEHAQAVATANELAQAKGVSHDSLFHCASLCARAAAVAKDKAPLQEQYAARAVELLRQAVAAGYKNVEHMKKDTDLDSLRGREDFQLILKQLEAKLPAQDSRPKEGFPNLGDDLGLHHVINRVTSETNPVSRESDIAFHW